jgi:serine kinase of HPr protein (carbohydrate metabolism regulator)
LKDAPIRLKDIVERLNLSVCCGEALLDRQVTGGYAGDLMSDVLAHSKPGNLWVTMQVHDTVAAIAFQIGLAAVVISHGREPAAGTVQKAREHNVPIMVSGLSTFETVAGLARLGLQGQNGE